AGLGSSTQHPRGSVIVTHTYGDEPKGALGVYNFAGDLGKATFPALTSLLLLALSWRHAVFVLAAIGVVVALALAAAHVGPGERDAAPAADTVAAPAARLGPSFAVLFVIGVLDTAPRMGFLLLLPFVLGGLHAAPATVGLALGLVFAGGAFGKFVCGWVGKKLGFVGTVATTEGMTALSVLVVPFLPLTALMVLLPLLGVALNGTSTVLYGTVPEAAKGSDFGHAFALFYTGVIGAGALAPIGFGALADAAGRPAALVCVGLTALLTIPLAFVLARLLKANEASTAGRRGLAGEPIAVEAGRDAVRHANAGDGVS
ncbi:MFS transporter, partial [Jatrophihabitans endophyticus]|uniref:MFS transporter n=1 Tax=Jatrophihabitans endophyticus TaxID=1206085 RepID=UPI0019DB59E7